jgi:hypothetical protein
VPGASSYLAKSATTAGGPYITIGTVTGATFTHTGLPMVTRYYIVAAQNFTGPGPDSAAVSATPESPDFTARELHGGTLALDAGGATLTKTMPSSVVGHTYQIQFTENLASGLWEDVGASQTGSGNDLPFTLPNPNTATGFFRFIISR